MSEIKRVTRRVLAMQKQRAGRNRTISLTETETDLYLSKCVCPTKGSALSDIIDTIIHGDALNVIDYLPLACVDLQKP